MVNGDGGTGKTHLLTKIANDLINNDVPTIIFYGQAIYKFEEYIKYIEQKMKIGDLFKVFRKQRIYQYFIFGRFYIYFCY